MYDAWDGTASLLHCFTAPLWVGWGRGQDYVLDEDAVRQGVAAAEKPDGHGCLRVSAGL